MHYFLFKHKKIIIQISYSNIMHHQSVSIKVDKFNLVLNLNIIGVVTFVVLMIY